jgi:hypothetical protein
MGIQIQTHLLLPQNPSWATSPPANEAPGPADLLPSSLFPSFPVRHRPSTTGPAHHREASRPLPLHPPGAADGWVLPVSFPLPFAPRQPRLPPARLRRVAPLRDRKLQPPSPLFPPFSPTAAPLTHVTCSSRAAPLGDNPVTARARSFFPRASAARAAKP